MIRESFLGLLKEAVLLPLSWTARYWYNYTIPHTKNKEHAERVQNVTYTFEIIHLSTISFLNWMLLLLFSIYSWKLTAKR